MSTNSEFEGLQQTCAAFHYTIRTFTAAEEWSCEELREDEDTL